MNANKINTRSLNFEFELDPGISKYKFVDEQQIVNTLLQQRPYDQSAAAEISRTAAALVRRIRETSSERPIVDTFLKEYGLSNQEGVALMCLAESLLRVPDRHTADLLIADKISSADWAEHAGKADDLLVNASTWGLILTGQLVSIERAFTANPQALDQGPRRAHGRADYSPSHARCDAHTWTGVCLGPYDSRGPRAKLGQSLLL